MIYTKKSIFKFTVISLIILFAGIFISCDDKIMGYSVVLWNAPEYKLRDGDVVPVYIRSNISQVYVIGDETGTKVEIPLWQLTEPVKKNKVEEIQKKYNEYAHNYASVKADGLPARSDPVNTSKQVYRLRKGEVIKILYKGKGTAPMTGGVPLQGDWFRILTADGTQGWCFSYNLALFETDELGQRIGDDGLVEEEEEDKYWNSIPDRIWYPDNFRTLIQNNNIDLSVIHPSFNFMIDTENQKVILNLSTIHESWEYTGFSKTDERQYTLKGIPIIVIYKKSGFIVVRYTGSDGKPQELNFVHIDSDINEIIAAEKTRRTEAYSSLVTSGPVFASSNYGTLTLNEDGSFGWTNYKLLVPSIISPNSKGVGTASVKYALGKNLIDNYDGVLTFKFDSMTDEVNFLYKLESGRLRLEDATEASYNGNLVTAKSSSPIIISFIIK